MTTYIEYDTETGRITRRAWPDKPAWFGSPKTGRETAHVTGFDQQDRQDAFTQASEIHEPGEDYNPDTETSIGYLVYHPDTDTIEAAAEIREREEIE